MRIEIDFDEKHVTVKEIDHYIELEKRMKELFGQDRINWKITFSQEITTGSNPTFSRGTFSPPGSFTQGTGNVTYQGHIKANSGSIVSSGLAAGSDMSDTFDNFTTTTLADAVNRSQGSSQIKGWKLTDLLPGSSNKKDGDNE